MEARARRIEGTFAGLPLRGMSVAGRETWFHFPTLGFAFDLGRSPWELVPVPHVFLSHAHLDHGAGLAYVSCSPYRVPLARLAAAQAALAEHGVVSVAVGG